MKRFVKSEAGAVVLWILGSLVLAATLAPWLHAGGKSLAAHAAENELNGILEWLAAACDRAKFGRYFNRSLMLSALALLPFLARRLKRLKPPAPRLETSAPGGSAALQWLAGLLIAGGLLWLLGLSLEAAGAFDDKIKEVKPGKWLRKAVIPALATSFLGEWLFRGLLLGVWLRVAKPLTACLGTSLVFAFVHFLEPPPHAVIANPSAPGAGFELLGEILKHFTDPRFFVTDFLTLFAIGLILAWTRLRTGRLWMAIGLHAGWVAAFKSFNLMHDAADVSALRPWGVGDSLRSGLLPLATLLLTAWVCHLAMKWLAKPARPPANADA